MLPLSLARPGDRLSVLCLGAHSDDIEIGAGGTLLGLMEAGVRLDIHVCVLSACGRRRDEAEASARDFLAGAQSLTIEVAQFPDSYFPYDGAELKAWLGQLRDRTDPDVVFTHRAGDAHQDHREVRTLTWNAFRDHLILEYEIPKWDGDLGRPNLYVPMTRSVLDRKIDLLMKHFGSQRSKDWFDPETFRGLARLRGMECRAPERYAEAFTMSKAVVACGLPVRRAERAGARALEPVEPS